MNYRHTFITIIILLILSPIGALAAGADKTPTFAMCHPTEGQIKNIVELYERNIITLDKIQLIGVYHEDEADLDDFKEAKEYVEDEKLSWISFHVIKEKVDTKNLFKQNKWTPQFKEIFHKTHGIIFTGGWDLPPKVYGEEDLLLTEAETPYRSLYETSFLFHLLGGSQTPEFVPFLESKKDYVVLGICLGAQTMNVATGGSLVQDIPSQIYGLNTVQQVLEQGPEKIHSSRYIKALHPLEEDFPPALHRIKFTKNSIFIKQFKYKSNQHPYILSSHHQALKKTGKNLYVTATSMDGKIPEIIQHQKYQFVLGVQFHPEYYPLYKKGRFYRQTPGAPLDFNLRIFLRNNPPSMKFHHTIWSWFSNAIQKSYQIYH